MSGAGATDGVDPIVVGRARGQGGERGAHPQIRAARTGTRRRRGRLEAVGSRGPVLEGEARDDAVWVDGARDRRRVGADIGCSAGDCRRSWTWAASATDIKGRPGRALP